MSIRGQVIAIAIFFAVLVLISFSGWTLAGPASWLEAWVKLFGTVIAIVAGLKVAWSVPDLLKALVEKR